MIKNVVKLNRKTNKDRRSHVPELQYVSEDSDPGPEQKTPFRKARPSYAEIGPGGKSVDCVPRTEKSASKYHGYLSKAITRARVGVTVLTPKQNKHADNGRPQAYQT